jgi:hypothetical protein
LAWLVAEGVLAIMDWHSLQEAELEFLKSLWELGTEEE